MVDPVYVPFLPVRRDAWQAYERLDARVRRRIAPLWTVVPRTGPERSRGDRSAAGTEEDPTLFGPWLTQRIDSVMQASSSATGWVDTTHVERLEVTPVSTFQGSPQSWSAPRGPAAVRVSAASNAARTSNVEGRGDFVSGVLGMRTSCRPTRRKAHAFRGFERLAGRRGSSKP